MRQLAMASQENSALGCCPDKSWMPNSFIRVAAASLKAMGSCQGNTVTAKKEPIKIPPANTRFQDSLFQSWLRNSKLLGMQAAHRWRNEELMPNVRFSKIRWRGTINPMMGPATYQGQG